MESWLALGSPRVASDPFTRGNVSQTWPKAMIARIAIPIKWVCFEETFRSISTTCELNPQQHEPGSGLAAMETGLYVFIGLTATNAMLMSPSKVSKG